MLSLSQTTGYAVLALSCLDKDNKEWVLLDEIADQTHIPKAYLVKVLKKLSQKNLIITKRGYRGGVALNRPADQITLWDVAEAVEGKDVLPECLLGIARCENLEVCPTFPFWKDERKKIRKELTRIKVEDLIDRANSLKHRDNWEI